MTSKRVFTGSAMLFVLVTLAACGGGGGGGGGGSNVARFAFTADFNDNTVSSYVVNPTTGQLRHNGYVPAGANPVSVAVHPSGQFVYVTNYGTGSPLSVYAVRADGTLSALTSPDGCTICQPRGMAIDPMGRVLYVAFSAEAGSTIESYSINTDGTLVWTGTNSLVATPFSITIDRVGAFAYVTSFNDGSVSAFAIQSSGALIPVDTDAVTPGNQANIASGGGTHAFTIHPSGRLAYAVSYDVGMISIYTVNTSTGALTYMGYVDVVGTGTRSVAIDPTGRFLYAANLVNDVIAAFAINTATGALTALAGSPYAVTDPASVTVDPSGKFLYVTSTGANATTVFTLGVDGAPGAARVIAGRNGTVEMAMTSGHSAVRYTPKAAFVANVYSSTLSQFDIATNGQLAPMTTASVASSQPNPSWVTTDPRGNYLYAGASNGTVGQYAIGVDGVLNALTPSTAALPGGGWSSMVAIDPSGRFAYVPNQLNGNVAQFAVGSDGTLASLSTPTVVAGSQPAYAAVDPTGRFVYVANIAGDSISQFTINTNGTLAVMGVPSVPAGDRPNAIAIHPSGRFAYVCNTGSADNTVSQYAIGTNGALSSIGANVATGNEPLGLAIDPSGRYLYVANRSDSTVTQYTIGANGVLAPMGTPSVSIPGGGPIKLAVDPSGRYVYTTNQFGSSVSQFSIGTDGALSVLGTAISTGTDTGPLSIVITGDIQ